MTASPRVLCLPKWKPTFLTGLPSACCSRCGVQSTSNPQLLGAKGDKGTPRSASAVFHAPVEPSRGQVAPPSPSTVADACWLTSCPPPASKRSAPLSSQPVQRWRLWSLTPSCSSRVSQARSRGEALKLSGNTRPLLPTKVPSPNRAHQSRRSSGVKSSMMGVSSGARSA